MRNSLIALYVLVFAVFLTAQARTGNIFGRVVDPEGNPVPGATVTLIPPAGASMTTVATADGTFRFLSLPPSKEYKIKAEQTGFKARTEENIIVVVGGDTNLEIKMEMGVMEEQVTVTAVSPVVDTKKTSVGQNVTQDILQSMPTARDPWVVLQMVPSVTVDRENLGGTDSGQQAYFVAKGGSSGQNMWSVDGVLVTDPSAIGASPTYYDFDAFEEMRVTTGGGDITSQTGGVAMDLVTRRGGNRVNLGGRFYVTDPTFQAAYSPSKLSSLGIARTNIIRGIKDYGFNLGGPILRDKIWLWGSYGVQDIKTNNLYGVADDTLLTNYVAKLNIQVVPENRFEIFFHGGNKEKFGRDATYSFPGGFHQTQRFHFGTPIWKAQDEHMFGDNLLVSLKFAYSHAGFSILPMVNETLDKWVSYDETTQIYGDSYYYLLTNRPMLQFNFYTNYFNDHLMGVSHDIKFGVEYSRRFTTTDSSTPGNTLYNYNINYPTLDVTADGVPDIVPGIKYISTWRPSFNTDSKVEAWAGYVNDTITIGRLNLILGLRYDYQKPFLRPFTMSVVNDNPVWKNDFTTAAKDAINRAFPGLSIPGNSTAYNWSILSPRLGLTYDLTGDGKTILKGSFSGYGEFMGTAESNYFFPEGAAGWMDFWWFDDGDGTADLGELFWFDPNTYAAIPAFDASGNVIRNNLDISQYLMWGGYDFDNPQQVGKSRYTIDPNTNSQNTWEAVVTLEREILTDFAVALDLTWRKYNNVRWERAYYPDTGHIRNSDDYVIAGQVPDLSSLGIDMGIGAGKDWYVLNPSIVGTDFIYYGPRAGFNQQYYGADLRLTKRLSSKWMLDGSLSYQYQKQHFDKSGTTDPTQLWAINDRVFSQSLGEASGKISQYVFSRWMVKLEGLYQLPMGFNLSATFTAREGHINPHSMSINDSRILGLERSKTVYLDYFDTFRLPTFWNLNARLEKMIKIGDTGRIYLMADAFNVFNNAIMNRRYDKNTGKYYITQNKFVPSATSFIANEVLNPRVVRFGVRFSI